MRNFSRLRWGRGTIVCCFSTCLSNKFAKATGLKITLKLISHKIILHFMQICNKNLMILTLDCSVLSVVRTLSPGITGQERHRR